MCCIRHFYDCTKKTHDKKKFTKYGRKESLLKLMKIKEKACPLLFIWIEFFFRKLLRAKKIEIFDVRSAFRTNSLPGSGSSSANNSLGRSLRNDLLVAADSVTNAMSTLVRELNSGKVSSDFNACRLCKYYYSSSLRNNFIRKENKKNLKQQIEIS